MNHPQNYSWLAELTQHYQSASAECKHADTSLLEPLNELIIASATLHKLHMYREHPAHTTHLALIGPTQSGKSTLVNVILDRQAANVSPLAGFTVHTQGYGRRIDDTQAALVKTLLHPLVHAQADSLDGEQLDSYVLEPVNTGQAALIDKEIVWDTPDFDSISAANYSLAVLKTAALADVVILMVSKDKYGDKRVWDILALLVKLGKSLLVCINKVDDRDRSVIREAFSTRYVEYFGEPVPPTVLLPFVRDKDSHQTLPLDSQSHAELQQAIQIAIKQINRSAMQTCFDEYIKHHQPRWLEPLLAQLDAQEQWNTLIQSSIADADEYYTRHYLDNPDEYDTFNKALAQLLTLLEIPGVATKLVQARKIITWPARRLLGVGKQALNSVKENSSSHQDDTADREALVLERMLDNVLISLQRQLLEKADTPWWRSLDHSLRSELPSINQHYARASESAREAFLPEIDKAAAQLYEKLQTQPALLNSLRAARLGTDAAAVALAVKSGGLAPTDLVLAPALVSMTSLLTENALGRYLDTVKRDLKRRQRAHIKATVLEKTLQTQLMMLANTLSDPKLMRPSAGSELDEYMQLYRQQHLRDSSPDPTVQA